MKHNKVADIVKELYISSSIEFVKWMRMNHVPIVAQNAERLTKLYKGNPDYSVAGAWLHDLADVSVERDNPKSEEISIQRAEEVLICASYTQQDIRLVIHEVLLPHSCHPGNIPNLLEGKILSTADALAHISTDFYTQLCWLHIPSGKTYEEFRSWVKEKIERDFRVKIFFDEVRDEVKDKYRAIKTVFIE